MRRASHSKRGLQPASLGIRRLRVNLPSREFAEPVLSWAFNSQLITLISTSRAEIRRAVTASPLSEGEAH